MTYDWNQRKNLSYYGAALDLIRRHAPQASTLLDVGGGITYGARYLDKFPGTKTCVELPGHLRKGGERWAKTVGIELVLQDFMTCAIGRRFDVVTCLQCVEHVEDPVSFCAKLLATADKLLVVSVPYKWKSDREPSHLHDPIDEAKMLEWTGRVPHAQTIIDERLVAAYFVSR